MNKMIFANLVHRPFRTIISVVAVAVEVTLILLIVGLSIGMLNDAKNRQAGIGADIMVQPPNSSLLMGVSDVAVSSGSACTSATLEPSYVIRALGTDEELAHSSIRFGLGRFNTEEEVEFVTDRVCSEVKRLREMSPLYEMAKEGIDLKSVNWKEQ